MSDPTSISWYVRAMRRWQSAGNFAIFVLPSLVIFIAVVLVPIIWTLMIGLTNERASRADTSFIGFDNYTWLLSNTEFQSILMNTVIIAVIVVLFTNILGLAIALLIRPQSWFYSMLRSVYFTPVILSSVVVSVIWRSLLLDQGLINNSLRALGIENPPGWLSDPDIALYSVAWILVWQLLGFAIVVYLAGLSSIPEELEEAASLDGARGFTRFRMITWPLLAPSFTIITVMMMISSFKVFDQIAVLTNGGPGIGGTATIAFEIVQTAFTEQRSGVASAMAGIMLVIIASASALVLRILQRREVNY